MMAVDKDRQFRLQRFWGTTVFSLGILWGSANIVYCPIAAMTSIVGSSWFEVFIIVAGGLLTGSASVAAFVRRGAASRVLLVGGTVLLLLAVAGQTLLHDISGVINLALFFLSGSVALLLGIFGIVTARKGWPSLR